MYHLTNRPLFGGAIRIGVPTRWRDVSDVRQVPDHQEVWQDCTIEDQTPSENQGQGNAPIQIEGTGGVLVVEILGRENGVTDDGAAKFFFDDLADSNGANVDGVDRRLDFMQTVAVGTAAATAAARATSTKDTGDGTGDDVNLMPSLNRNAIACTCIGVQRVSLGKERAIPGQPKSDSQNSRWAVRVELCALRLEEVETDLLISLTRPIQNGADKGMDETMEIQQHSQLFLEIIGSFSVENWDLFG
mmetsp:Transcript_4546/g.10180  ORF Transcript_4546/g.10180 Transcript_4546/m.10180 type:complete len:246 (+) Transcript_4546:147-884(+)|eukprot:CAMPEP_0178503736 /NCGR_PEP_ID=MMETSP0696-20121128/18201_1 /TAXON_ID=265572 /ORGANISM="Extubocellulus spinifer, Strain CCMP396" /LENGTH=245 /DNA_ID=CAMNT_0020132889 /DNA_START=95 /DNA_END=832 /DNA_ORIENTATION=-